MHSSVPQFMRQNLPGLVCECTCVCSTDEIVKLSDKNNRNWRQRSWSGTEGMPDRAQEATGTQSVTRANRHAIALRSQFHWWGHLPHTNTPTRTHTPITQWSSVIRKYGKYLDIDRASLPVQCLLYWVESAGQLQAGRHFHPWTEEWCQGTSPFNTHAHKTSTVVKDSIQNGNIKGQSHAKAETSGTPAQWNGSEMIIDFHVDMFLGRCVRRWG